MLTIENDDRHALFKQFYYLLWRGAMLVMSGRKVHLNFLKLTFPFDVFFYSDNASQTFPVNTLYFTKDNVRTSIKNFTNRILAFNKRRGSWHKDQPDKVKP